MEKKQIHTHYEWIQIKFMATNHSLSLSLSSVFIAQSKLFLFSLMIHQFTRWLCELIFCVFNFVSFRSWRWGLRVLRGWVTLWKIHLDETKTKAKGQMTKKRWIASPAIRLNWDTQLSCNHCHCHSYCFIVFLWRRSFLNGTRFDDSLEIYYFLWENSFVEW